MLAFQLFSLDCYRGLPYTPAPKARMRLLIAHRAPPRAFLPAAELTQFPTMDEGSIAMNGSDAQARLARFAAPRKNWSRWLWTIVTVSAVVAVCFTIRFAGLPQ